MDRWKKKKNLFYPSNFCESTTEFFIALLGNTTNNKIEV